MKKRLAALITALVLCLLAPLCASAEVKARNIEKNGKITETVWEDEHGNPAAGPEGYYSVKYTVKGYNTIEMYYGADGEAFEVAGGYCGRRVNRDAKGNILEIEYLDENGDRTMNAAGYALTGITYYGFGEVRSVTYYGMNKKPVTVPSLGYASVFNEYSGKTMTSRTFKDAKGNPVDGKDGYAAVRQKVDKRYIVQSIRYDHADGSPAVGPDGWFRCVKERDDKGRLVSVKYYDTSMQLTDRGASYAWEGYSYEGDTIVLVTRYDLSDTPVADEAGVVTVVREMMEDRVVRERFLDAEGKRVNNSLGVGEIIYSYDHQGGLEKVAYQDTEGNPVRCVNGYAGYRDTKDEDGATVSRTYLGLDGMPAEIPGGYSEVRYFYDETKTLTSTRYYDLNGKQVQAQ